MTDKEYDFEEQDKVEESFTPLTLKYLKGLFEKEPENVRHLHLEYDFKVGDLTFDLKADTIMASTKNFFIETESVKGKKRGWFYNQNTDWILYLDTINKLLYMLDLKRLQLLEVEVKRYPYCDHVKQKQRDYETCGYKVPIEVICKWTGAKAISVENISTEEGKMKGTDMADCYLDDCTLHWNKCSQSCIQRMKELEKESMHACNMEGKTDEYS